MISVHAEAGTRIGELLGMKIKEKRRNDLPRILALC